MKLPRAPLLTLAGCALLGSDAVHAAEPLMGQALRTLGALLFVLLVMAALAWGARRLRSHAGFSGGNRLRVVETMPLGVRDKLLLVEFDGRTCLVGVGQSGIQALAEGSCSRCEPRTFDRELEASQAALAE